MDLISREAIKTYISAPCTYLDGRRIFYEEDLDLIGSPFEGMTNGEVFQAIFPCDEVLINGLQEGIVHFSMKSNLDSLDCLELEWWNAPYQKGGQND